MYALMGAVGGTVAIATLTVISIDRYNVVVYPLRVQARARMYVCGLVNAHAYY